MMTPDRGEHRCMGGGDVGYCEEDHGSPGRGWFVGEEADQGADVDAGGPSGPSSARDPDFGLAGVADL